MCIGIPMRVVSLDGLSALCERRDGSERKHIDLALVGPLEPGAWVLVFLDAARSLMSAEEAAQVDDALAGLEAALRGDSFDHLFADLIDREPQLPEHLRPVTPSDS